MSKTKEKAYVVFVEPRIVLFGYSTEENLRSDKPMLKNARLCVYWSKETRGQLGLAERGPQEGSRVTPQVTEHHICTKVEAFIPCTERATKQWESEPWN